MNNKNNNRKHTHTFQTNLLNQKIPEKISTLQYRGNKLQVIDFLLPHFKGARSILDLMAGSQSVGSYLKQQAQIISNDIQHYSYVLGKAYVENNKYQKIEAIPLKKIRSNPNYTLFSDYYSNTYFTPEQANEIDAIRARIDEIKLGDEILYYCYLACLLKTLDLVSRTAGHFYGYVEKDSEKAKLRQNKSVYNEFSKICRNFKINVSNFKHKCYNLPAAELFGLIDKVDIMYLDPPYNRRQYSNYYHILEMCSKYEGELENDFKTLLPKRRFKSKFCNKQKVSEAFREILDLSINRVKQKIIISYTNKGFLSKDELNGIFLEYSKNIEYYEKNINYTKQKTSLGREFEKELLFVLNI